MRRLLFISALACICFAATAQKKTASKTTTSHKTTGSKNSTSSMGAEWNVENRLSFLNNCIKGSKMSADSANQYCYCMLEKVAKIYPTVFDAEKNFTAAKAVEMAKTCLGCFQSSTWSEADKSSFTDQCVASAKDNLGEERAKEYCSCVLQKIQLLYPVAADAAKLTAIQVNVLAAQCNQKQ